MRKEIHGAMLLALMVTAGCSSEKAVTTPVAEQPKVEVVAPKPVVEPVQAPQSGYGFDQWQTGPVGDVFFSFDNSGLSADAQEQLKQDAAWLSSNAAKNVVIEGHCDSRGTAEYNLALGERRASSAKEYLVRLGVASSRLETVSLGEERPFDTGKGEKAWAKNRRAHFIVK